MLKKTKIMSIRLSNAEITSKLFLNFHFYLFDIFIKHKFILGISIFEIHFYFL